MNEGAWTELVSLFPAFSTRGRWMPILQRHAAMIEAARERVDLTSDSGDGLVLRHFGESLELAQIVESEQPARIVDMGSGAGFPGVVLAAIFDDAEVVLLEPRKKRAAWLEATVSELGLGNARVIAERAEDAANGELRGRFALATARAVASLPVLFEYGAPLLAPGGLHAYPKGSRRDEELEASAAACEELGCRVTEVVPMRSEVSETIAVVLARQERAAGGRYPRRAGVAARRPIVH